MRQPQLGKCLRELRERHRLSREELARATGIAPSSIYRLETGADTRLSAYIAVVEFLVGLEPTAAMIAERVVALPEPKRARLVAMLEELENDGS